VKLALIVSFEFMLVTARDIANGAMKFLIGFSLIMDSFLGLPIAVISFVSTDAIRRPGTLTSIVLSHVRTILLFDRGSYSLELLAREIELSSNMFC